MQIRKIFNVLFLFFISINYCLKINSQTPINGNTIDSGILNIEVLKQVNKLRKQAKVQPLTIENALSLASKNHAYYMLEHQKLTHKQKYRKKRTPKNRVDYFGQLFDRVGENIQLNNLNLNESEKEKTRTRIDTYEKLAEQLVLSWKNSPPHYANMINGDFSTTYTSVAFGSKNEIYACQLFGGAKYLDKYHQQKEQIDFKPNRPWKCWRCKLRPPVGSIFVTEDSTIIFQHYQRSIFFGLLTMPSIFNSRMRFFKPRKDGLAADIIIKSQYPCDSNSYFNGMSNVRGIPLEPVFKKDFKGGIGLKKTEIKLGKVPSYIDENFEVNLIVIQNKRPCSNTSFNVIPSNFHVNIPLSYDFEAITEKFVLQKTDTLKERIYFSKSMIESQDSTLLKLIEPINEKGSYIEKIEINAFASIEGSSEGNEKLHSERANYIIKILETLNIDSTNIEVNTAENFKDFRKNIKGTKFEYLDSLTNLQIKEKLKDEKLSNELEYILKNHRYVELNVIKRYDYKISYDNKSVNDQFRNEMELNNLRKCEWLQQIQYGLLKENKIKIEDVLSVDIPREKKYTKLLYNRAVMKHTLNEPTVETLKKFRAELFEIRKLNINNKNLNTSIAIIDYYLYEIGTYENNKITFFDSIKKWKYIDKVQQARILLNASTNHDWAHWNLSGAKTGKEFWYQKVKPYVRAAKLDVDKTFEIASYYAFFHQNKFAYNLVKNKIDETENPENLIFFLKLIQLTDIKLQRRIYLNYFKKIKNYSGKEFCTYFNSPALNFQIFDDEEIKKIFCEECKDNY